MNLSSPTFYDFGGTLALGYTPNRLPNPDLTWERTREYDLGLDYGLCGAGFPVLLMCMISFRKG